MVRKPKAKGDAKRVEMTSSASPRPINVPEAHVARYEANGWTLVPPATKRATKTEPKASDS